MSSGIDTRNLVSFELLLNRGPWSLQGEYIVDFLSADNEFNTPDKPYAVRDGMVHGFYVTASYFLTGEYRTYNRKTGLPDRVVPNRNFSFSGPPEKRGWGAWQLATRCSMIDYTNLYDQAHGEDPVLAYRRIVGKGAIDYTVGLNWHFNPNARMMFNCIATRSDANCPSGEVGMMYSFGTRVQVGF